MTELSVEGIRGRCDRLNYEGKKEATSLIQRVDLYTADIKSLAGEIDRLKEEAAKDQARWEWMNGGNLSIERKFPMLDIQGTDSGGRDHVTMKLWEGWEVEPGVEKDFEGNDLRTAIDFVIEHERAGA